MKCPKCGSENTEVVVLTTGKTKGFGLCKGCFGTLILGPIGWLCGLCGMGKGKLKSKTRFVCKKCGKQF